MDKSSSSKRKSLLDRSEKKSLLEKSGKSGKASAETRSAATTKDSATTLESRETKESKDEVTSKSKAEEISKEAADEVSIEGPKKSDGSEFRKGCKGWTMSFTYLGILWLCGFVFTALIMYVLLIQLPDMPHYFGKGSHIGGTPHLIFEPNPNRFDVRTKGVIQFQPGDPRTYHNHMVRYRKVLTNEYNSTNAPKCSAIRGALDGAPTNESTCDMEAGSAKIFKQCALTLQNIRKGMGFGNGEPCIMLRLTRMLGWFPEDAEVSKERNCYDGSANCCDRRRLQFLCEPVKNSATIRMLPSDGISTCAFPFWNRQGYQQPFVMLKVTNLTSGKTEIRCRPSQRSIQFLDDFHENVIKIYIEKLS